MKVLNKYKAIFKKSDNSVNISRHWNLNVYWKVCPSYLAQFIYSFFILHNLKIKIYEVYVGKKTEKE